jgi:hypothetical protein
MPRPRPKGSSRSLPASTLHRIHTARRELETAALELKRALDEGRTRPAQFAREILARELPPLERAAAALRAVVQELARRSPRPREAELADVYDLAQVVARASGLLQAARAAAAEPSLAARALALLLETSGAELDAATVAERLGCGTPIARTTLHRLVRGGHAVRTALGRFRAKG